MSIFFHPNLFDDARYQADDCLELYERISHAVVANQYGWEIDGYDIISFRIEERPYRPIGSLVDFLIERLPAECAGAENVPEALSLLGKITEGKGNLVEQTEGIYLGYLTAREVIRLGELLRELRLQTSRSTAEQAALIKILAIAQERGLGLIYSMG